MDGNRTIKPADFGLARVFGTPITVLCMRALGTSNNEVWPEVESSQTMKIHLENVKTRKFSFPCQKLGCKWLGSALEN
ncbi:hypothetical protein Celaphus_00011251, partial [Cervus elaphus hippelaphus]